jgi:16S rRNA (cytidine1402-2'-O)-methyltransferase
VFYESPFRLLKTLAALVEVAPNLDVMVARELTKIHEECVSGSATEVLKEFSERPSIKGEIVIILRSAEHSARDDETSEQQI